MTGFKFKTHKHLWSAVKFFVKNEEECVSEYGEINTWDVSSIYIMDMLFYNSSFNGDISNWDVSNVRSMRSMFESSQFNGDISRWDVSNVENMNCMFRRSKFDGDISKWNVSKVRDMIWIFSESEFDGDISDWKLMSVHVGFYINIMIRDCKDRRKEREDKASKIIQDWWMEILLNPHHPVGKDYLHRQAVEVCSY